MEGADDQAFFDCTLDFEDGPPVGSEEDLLPDDGRGGTEEQRRGAIAAMRERVMKDSSAGDKLTCRLEDRNNLTLERFLRARDFNVPVASALFISHRKWRQSFAWRIPASDLPRQLPGQTKVALQGKCREGQPLMILIARNHISKFCDLEESKKFIVYCLDKMINAVHPGQKFHVLVDLAGLTSKNADIKAILAAFDMLQACYVERCAHLWFAEPPTIFWAIWKVVSPFVATNTRKKIAFLYGKELRTVLAEHFELSVLPKVYGGTATSMTLVDSGPAPWEGDGGIRLRQY